MRTANAFGPRSIRTRAKRVCGRGRAPGKESPMTDPFERQIIDALAALFAARHVRMSPDEFSELVTVLAPGVAAAIREAIVRTTVVPSPVPHAWEQPIYAVALAALRGSL